MDKIKIKGLKELSDAMGQLPGAIAKRVLAGAVRKAALIVQARAIALAPEAVAAMGTPAWCLAGGPQPAPLRALDRGQPMASNSTSNSKVALGGITPPAPRAP